MSFDLPASLERDIEQYARDEQITPQEAAVKLLNKALSSTKRKAKNVVPVTDAEINQLKALSPLFGLLEDVPEEQIDRMSATIRRMKRERFPARA